MQLPLSANHLPELGQRAVPDSVRAAITRRASAPGADPVSGYFYDLGVAADRARTLRAALPRWAQVLYAVKANSYPPVLAALAPHVDGFEVASAREAVLARSTSDTALLAAAGPGKSVPMLAELVRSGVDVINVESPLELHRVDAAARQAGRRQRVGLRVNPDRVEVSGSLQMGGAATQFGMPETDVPAAVALARTLPGIELVGFHIHAVCNNLDADAHARYVRWCVDHSIAAARQHGFDLQVVDVGGGLGVPFMGEVPFDVARFGELLAGIAPPDGVRVVFEPGRYLVTDCGFYAAEVTDVKVSRGTTFVVLRGGINHFQLPTSWDILHRFAVLPVAEWPHPYPRPGARDASVTVVGELCTPEDTLAVDMHVQQVRAGDVVVFPMAGSYGYEFAMPAFLGHPPAERHVI